MLQFKWFKLSWFAGVAKYLSLVEKSICNSCKSNQRNRNLWLGLYGIIYKARMWSAGSWWRRADPGSEHLHRDRRHHSPCSPLLSLLLCQVNLTIIILFSLGFFINLIKCSNKGCICRKNVSSVLDHSYIFVHDWCQIKDVAAPKKRTMQKLALSKMERWLL